MRNRIEMRDGVCEMVIVSKKYGEKRVRIDPEDCERVQEWKWCLAPISQKDRVVFYIRTTVGRRPERKALYLHRFLIAADSNLQVDHIDGNSLNNKRSNLRLVTNQQNNFNRRRAKGYSWDKARNKWRAQITKDGRHVYLGLFNTQDEARAAYSAAKDVHHRIVSA